MFDHSLKAAQSYDVAALDYLVKFIPFERLMQAVVQSKEKHAETGKMIPWEISDVPATAESVWLREEIRLLPIPYQKLLYVEGNKHCVKVFLAEQPILTHLTLGKATKFFRPGVCIYSLFLPCAPGRDRHYRLGKPRFSPPGKTLDQRVADFCQGNLWDRAVAEGHRTEAVSTFLIRKSQITRRLPGLRGVQTRIRLTPQKLCNH